jgi:hypothetical protein
MKEKLKSICYAILGVGFFLLIPLVFVLFIHGSAWVSEKVLPVLSEVGAISFLALILIGLPLSIFKKCRGACALVFVYWSYLCGLCLWMTSLLLTINLWGYIAAIIGLFLAGVGVFPIAVLACLFKGEWSLFFQLILQFVILIAARFYGFYLASKADEEAAKTEFEVWESKSKDRELLAAFETLQKAGHELTPTQEELLEKLKADFELSENDKILFGAKSNSADDATQLAAEIKSLRDSLTNPNKKP